MHRHTYSHTQNTIKNTKLETIIYLKGETDRDRDTENQRQKQKRRIKIKIILN